MIQNHFYVCFICIMQIYLMLCIRYINFLTRFYNTVRNIDKYAKEVLITCINTKIIFYAQCFYAFILLIKTNLLYLKSKRTNNLMGLFSNNFLSTYLQNEKFPLKISIKLKI